MPVILQAQPSCGGTSPVGDDESYAAKIAALEKRQDQLEKWIQNVKQGLKELAQLGG
jgi:hypothetical protein